MNNPKKGQHFVPSTYLRGFCDEAGKLHLYDFVNKEFRSNIMPDEVAKKKHIYTIKHKGNKDYRIENFFGEIETRYGELIKPINNGRFEQLTEKDFQDMIWFISFLYARNLSKVDQFSEMMQSSLSFIGNGLLNYNLQQQGEEHLRPLIQIKPDNDYVQIEAMKMMYETAQTLYELLTNEGKWFFCVSQTVDSEFITTDNPVANTVRIPLTKKVLFMRVTEQIDGLHKKTLHVTPDWVDNINCQMASSVKRCIYASSKKIIKEDYIRMKA